MKIGKGIALLGMSLIVCGSPLQATIMTNTLEQSISIEEQYIDTSSYQLPYKSIPGFLVAPLQVPGELLAPFNQDRTSYWHEGIDIRAKEGTPIFAIADGIVTKAAPDSKGVENGGGHMIFINFGDGVEGRYMHLEAYGVKLGDKVKAGQVIGFTGNTGDSTTPHLHFEYRINNTPVDPAFIFEASGMIQGKEIMEITNKISYSVNAKKENFYITQE